MPANTPTTVVLFDLDNTLLPIDSDYAWGQYLVALGVVSQKEYAQANDRFYSAYKDGTLDIHEFLQFALKPLSEHPRATLDAWRADFIRLSIVPQIHPKAISLVQHHQSQGHVCAMVTATNSFVTQPIAQLFGIQHLLATEPEVGADGTFTGKVQGIPNFQAGKVWHVNAWLTTLGLSWDHLAESIFYSDSINDLPLLEHVTTPVVANPDPTLALLAKERSWKIIHLFA